MITPPRFPDLLVLVADASEFNRRIMRDALRCAGIKRFIDAQDGPSVVKSALRLPPDLMILDADLGYLSAIEVMRMVTLMPRSDIPSILVTSRPSPDLIAKARDAGVREILTKPITHTGLWMRVASVLRDRIAPQRASRAEGLQLRFPPRLPAE